MYLTAFRWFGLVISGVLLTFLTLVKILALTLKGGECIVGVMVRPIANLFHTRHVAINLAMSPKFTDATDVLPIFTKIFLHLTMNFDHSGPDPGHSVHCTPGV